MAITYGTSAVTLVCDLLVARGVCDYRQAFALAEEFDRQLGRCSWIDTQDGVTFTRHRPEDSTVGPGRQFGF